MLTDGLKLIEGTDISNAVVDRGTSYPANPDAGELFFRTDLVGLYIYSGTQWEAVGSTSSTLEGQTGAYYLNLANHTGTLDLTSGGTGATTAAAARTNLGLVIGTDVQAFDADLDAIAGLSGTSGLLRKTAANTWALDTASYLPVTGGTVTGNITMTGHIIPSANITYDLGSPTMQWKDIYVGPGSLYVNGKKVIEDVSDTIVFGTSVNQNLRIETEGTGSLEFQTSNTSSIQLKGTVTLTSGRRIVDSAGTQVEFGDDIQLNGNKVIGSGVPTNPNDLATKAYVDAGASNDGTIVRTSGAQTIGGDKTFSTNIVVPLIPTAATHAASKDYVDGIASGVNPHASVKAATVSQITLAGTQTVDGVSLSAGNRVLVKDQAVQSTNGIYVVAAGAWTRATDFDGSPTSEVVTGDLVFVEGGTANGSTSWVLITQDAITVGTTALVFTLFSRTGDIVAGAGLTRTANTFSITDVGTAGTYHSVTTNSRGQVIAGTNPSTLSGYGITDAVPLTGAGATGTWNIDVLGNSATSTALQTGRTIGVSGITGTAQLFDGTANITIPVSEVPATLLTGTVATARLGTGTADATTYLRGDGTWTIPAFIPSGIAQNGGVSLGAVDFNGQPNVYATQFVNTTSSTNVPSGVTGNAYRFIMGGGDSATRGFELIGDDGGLFIRNRGTSYDRRVLDQTNFTSYAPSLTGTGASGTWSINISGDAATLGSFSPSTSATSSTVAVRNGSNQLLAGVLGQSSANNENPVISQVMVTNGSDNLFRKASIGHLTSSLSGTATISVTGAASLNVLKTGDTMTGALRLADGSAAVPALAFNSEASTGLFQPSTGILGFSVGGTERLRIDTSGNIILTNDLRWGPWSGGSSGQVITGSTGSSGPLQLFTSGVERLRLTADGYIEAKGGMAIGHATDTASIGFEIGGSRTGNGNAFIDFWSHAASDYSARIIRTSGENGVWIFQNTGTGTISFSAIGGEVRLVTNNIDRMTVTNSGNIGIGTSIPKAKLDISNQTTGSTAVSDIHLGYSEGSFYGYRLVNTNNPSSTAAGNFQLQRGNTSSWQTVFDSDNNGNGTWYSSLAVGSSVDITTGPMFRVRGNNGNTLRVYSAVGSVAGSGGIYIDVTDPAETTNARHLHLGAAVGTVGIGCNTSDPITARILGVAFGHSGNTGAFYARHAANVSNWAITSSSGSIVNFYSDNGSTHVFSGSISVSGSSTAYNTSSDVRLKKNIVDAPSAIAKVKAMQVRSFDWKEDDLHVEHGFIAQELNQVEPLAVTQGDTWAVDPSKLVATLTKALQEALATIESLSNRVETLEQLK